MQNIHFIITLYHLYFSRILHSFAFYIVCHLTSGARKDFCMVLETAEIRTSMKYVKKKTVDIQL